MSTDAVKTKAIGSKIRSVSGLIKETRDTKITEIIIVLFSKHFQIAMTRYNMGLDIGVHSKKKAFSSHAR